MAAAAFVTVLFASTVLRQERSLSNDAPLPMEYAETLFDPSYVHTIEIQVKDEDWRGMTANAEEEQYINCDITIDGTKMINVALRPKGMTSLSNVVAMGSERFSFKIDFDGFNHGTNYKGLDALCLNNIIQDNTYMKDYFSYRMMQEAGAEAPLCSYANITVNGKNFGLYLAVEAIEESFAKRVYGNDYGTLYKPELMPSSDENGNREVALQYKGDDPEQYPSIFNHAVFDTKPADRDRLIQALKALNEGENLSEAVNVEAVLRYFVAHNFVVNFDSYTGILMHNYYLHERDGQLSMVAWDYNLAFGGGAMTLPIGGTADVDPNVVDNATRQVNYPIDTPVSMTTLSDRPMLGRLLENKDFLEQYHVLFHHFLSDYMESGRFDEEYDQVYHMILQYVGSDPTKFCTTEQFMDSAAILHRFCTMRTQSVRGQLTGTIPATLDGQDDAPALLVDASSLDVNAMGTMMGDEMPFGENGMDTLDVGMVAEVFGLDSQLLEGKSQEEIVQTLIETMINQGQIGMMHGTMGDMQNTFSTAALYAGSSLILLVIGLFCVFKFKRRN